MPERKEAAGSSLYDAAYYRDHCGPVPYGRSPEWLSFFSNVAEQLIRSLTPSKVLDAGCAMGLLVEAFWDRGVEAWGFDISPYAISKVRPDIARYCRVGSITTPIESRFDLITCIEVLEHIQPEEARLAIANMTAASDRILFASTPADFDEPTHVNVQPTILWLRAFAEFGFRLDVNFDASFVAPHAMLLRKNHRPAPEELSLLFVETIRQRMIAARHQEQNARLGRELAAALERAARLEAEKTSAQAELLEADRRASELGRTTQLLQSERDVVQTLLDRASSRLESLVQENACSSEALRQSQQEREAIQEQLRRASGQVQDLLQENARSAGALGQSQEERGAIQEQLRRASGQVQDLLQENARSAEALRQSLEEREAIREQLRRASGQVEDLLQENARSAEALRQFQAERGAIQEQLRRVSGQVQDLCQENARRTEALHRTEEERRIVRLEQSKAVARLEAVYASPGWRWIQRYRNWLERSIWPRPWFAQLYEAVARRVLGSAGPASSAPPLVARADADSDASMPADRGPVVAGLVPISETLMVFCDFPRAGDSRPLRETVRVLGWAAGSKAITQVWVQVDDSPRRMARHGLPRPDVALHFPSFAGAAQSGFELLWDTTTIPDGRHLLRIVAAGQNGQSAEVLREITIDNRDPYQVWIERNEPDAEEKQRMGEDARQPPCRPVISIITPVYKTPLEYLSKCVESVLAQIYPHWELCLIDDGSNDPQLSTALREFQARDARIHVVTLPKNVGIAAATNEGLALATGEFVAFLDHDDELSDFALWEAALAFNQSAGLDVLYSDEDKLDSTGKRREPFFKPNWSPDLLLSCNYVCHFLICRRSLVMEIDGLREGFDGSQDYDLILRLSQRTSEIRRIPKVLYHWRAVPGSTALSIDSKPKASGAGRRALVDHLARTGVDANVDEVAECRYRVRRNIKEYGQVSIIIPTGGNLPRLEEALRSVLSQTTYPNYEIVVADNSSGVAVRFLVDGFQGASHPVRHLDFRYLPFNFSLICNASVRESKSPFVLLLNDDVVVSCPDWLTALVEHGQRPEVGAVGARLLFPDRRIQHAGVVMGVYGNAGHHFKGLNADQPRYFCFPDLIRNCSAVTGACLLTRRELFLQMGGFEEVILPVAFQDVDFCLRLHRKGYRIVYTPYAELYHHESSSKPQDLLIPNSREVQYMKQTWGDYIDDDPYYNPNLTREAEDYSLRI